MSGTLAELNPLRYRGYVYDQETGFYYLNSRYYDPAVGRFINPDAAIGQVGNIKGNNMFTYALNNPVMYGKSEMCLLSKWKEKKQRSEIFTAGSS